MTEVFKESIPIYLQLMEQIRFEIASGKRRPGARIESVRELAAAFGVNPNTVQRALSELEREDLLYSERTAGRFVTGDTDRIQTLRASLAEELTGKFLEDMDRIGCSGQEALELLRKKSEDTGGGDRIWTA